MVTIYTGDLPTPLTRQASGQPRQTLLEAPPQTLARTLEPDRPTSPLWCKIRRPAKMVVMVEDTGRDLHVGPGIDIGQLEAAVATSGYPLQIEVEEFLGSDYFVQQEWGFKDRESGKVRAMDLYVRRNLYSIADVNRYNVRPTLNLLIECKRSELPWVFFGGERARGGFPEVMGLPSRDIVVSTDDDRSTWTLPILNTLNMDGHDFLRTPESTSTFAAVTRGSGKTLKLSGSDIYSGSILPIRSAVTHLREAMRPRQTYAYFDAALALGVLVLDLPMVRATPGKGSESRLQSTKWQRLWRHEPDETGDGYADGSSSAIDIVHKDYFSEYMADHLVPFAEEFSIKAQRHARELADGKAFVSGMSKDSFTAIEDRMQPRAAPLIVNAESTDSLRRVFWQSARGVASKVGADIALRRSRRMGD